ncbi:hypothetical protein EMPG_14119 [Blastomyces silverae]|uniref:Uncharacterized protein n=1 Tax=Blastomyces silverae TaxID=2060906 RepID=A0A0H1BHB8_9EURO|nr:hypothetical protein EMPG_14119 [Blastomyces silverae]
MYLRDPSPYLALLLALSASTSASVINRSHSGLRIALSNTGPCSLKTENAYVSVFQCEKDICRSSPTLEAAGCCESDGCSWYKTCIPYDSVERRSSDPTSDTILSCPDSTQKYCQFATFRKESQPDSEYTRGICTSNPPEPDLRIDLHLLTANSEAIVSQALEDDRAYQLRIRAMSHRLSKRSSSLSSRNTAIVGGLVAFWACIILSICVCMARRKNHVSPATPAAVASAQNNTAVYVMAPQPGQPGQPYDPNVQSPPLAYVLPASSAQAAAGHTQTVYFQGPPPPGAQPIQFVSPPGPIPAPHPSYSQPPPAYHK